MEQSNYGNLTVDKKFYYNDFKKDLSIRLNIDTYDLDLIVDTLICLDFKKPYIYYVVDKRGSLLIKKINIKNQDIYEDDYFYLSLTTFNILRKSLNSSNVKKFIIKLRRIKGYEQYIQKS